MRIYKYILHPATVQTIRMPDESTILSVGLDANNMMALWAIVDPAVYKVERTFCVYGTGHELPDMRNQRFVGTVVMRPVGLVWHIFERLRSRDDD